MTAFPAFPTFNRSKSGYLSPGSSVAPKPRVLTAGFGGGYSQRTGDGINQMPREFNFRSPELPAATIATMAAFLESRKGYLAFTFIAPDDATARQWTCDTWQVDYTKPLHSTLTAKFVENFDP